MSDADDLIAKADAARARLDASTITVNGNTVPLDPRYKQIVGKYLGDGAAKAADMIRRGEQTIEKLEAVGKDYAAGAALGAGVGSVIPLLGTVVGGVVGSWVGGVYGVLDNFGGDIEQALHDTFNPEDFSSGQYDTMRVRCIQSGGLPVPGRAPDNEDGCIYPDGTTSGGDWPRHPAPGRMSVRGDSAWHMSSPPPPGMVPDPNGYPIPAFEMRGPVAKPFAATFRQVKMTPSLANALNQATLKAMANGSAPKPAPMPKVPPPHPAIHMAALGKTKLITLALGGDASAQKQVATTVDQARSGDPDAVAQARVLALAHRLVIRNQWVTHYLAVDASRPKNTGRAGVGGMQLTGGGKKPCAPGSGCCDDCGPSWSGAASSRAVGKMAGGLTANGFGGEEIH